MDNDSKKSASVSRKLGDEWLDWDGQSTLESTEADYRVFLGLAVLSTFLLIILAGLFLWLIFPRLASAGSFLPKLVSGVFLIFAGVLIIWLLLFVIAAATRRPFSRMIVIPRLVNRLLSIAVVMGKLVGVSRDRLANSFLKIHNIIIGSNRRCTNPERLLVLLPRCLTRDSNQQMRYLRDKYNFQMATVGGGSEARLKIKESRPKIVIAIACERDLIAGFKEINPYIPVIGFPNRRPEGPCKNTCVDPEQIEQAIRNCLNPADVSK
jgi:hypothetical protein